MLCLCCCAAFSLVVMNGGYSLVVVRGLLIAVASLMEHKLWGIQASVVMAHGLSSTGLVAPRHGIFPKSGPESLSPTLAGKFFTTELPGKPL